MARMRESAMDKLMSLQSILDAFKGPVNEEQTWAICFQVIKHVQDHGNDVTKTHDRNKVTNGSNVTNDTQSSMSQGELSNCVQEQSSSHRINYPQLSEPSQIIVHSDGSVSLENITSHVHEKEVIH